MTVAHQDDWAARIEKTSGDSVVCTAGMESLAMLHGEKKCGWTLADMLLARCHYLRICMLHCFEFSDATSSLCVTHTLLVDMCYVYIARYMLYALASRTLKSRCMCRQFTVWDMFLVYFVL